MHLTPKINHALIRAAVLHREQTRKDADVPYIVHPVADKLWFYEEVSGIIKERLESPIAGELEAKLAEIRKVT